MRLKVIQVASRGPNDREADSLADSRVTRHVANQRRPKPTNRRAGRGSSPPRVHLRRPAEDQPLLRPRHRHVEQPALLPRGPLTLLLPEALVGECVFAPAGAGSRDPQPEPSVPPDPHHLGGPPRTAAEVRDANDLELEPLGAVDRH